MAATTITSVPTGIAGAAVSITLLTTITVPIVALEAIMDTAASIMVVMAARTAPWATSAAGTMVAEASMAVEGFTVVEGFMVAEEAGTTET